MRLDRILLLGYTNRALVGFERPAYAGLFVLMLATLNYDFPAGNAR
jgi:hypothetical protein